MRLEIQGRTVRVTLSRRNLRTLLAKLDGNPPDSACEIQKIEDDGLLCVHAEPDDVHYSHASRYGEPPGAMHPLTEAAIRD